MESHVPKQFIRVLGHPLVAHTLLQMHEAAPEAEIWLVLPKKYLVFWKRYCDSISLPSHHVVCGGETRSLSVKEALNALTYHPSEQLVAVHDGVRPFVSKHILAEGLAMAKRKGSAVPMIHLPEALRKKTDTGTIHQDRALYYLVQTPQIFKLDWLRKAFQTVSVTDYVDESSVVEAANYPVHRILGSIENMKITYRAHLSWAEIHLKASAEALNTRLR